MTRPYQPNYSIQPKYGFRYLSQPFAPNIGGANDVNTGINPDYQPNYKVPDKPVSPVTPQVMDSSSGDDNNISEDPSRNIEVAKQLTDKGVYGPQFDPLSFLPGGSFFSGDVSPEKGYGSEGSISSLTGNIFDDKGRGVDPITGYSQPEFASTKSFYNYMMNDPMGNLFGDVDNQFQYSRDNMGNRIEKSADAYEYALANSPLGKDEDGLTQIDRDIIAKDIAMDMGIPESSLGGFDNPTINAIQGAGYTGTGAAPEGSQFSSTGTFTSTHTKPDDPTEEDIIDSTGITTTPTTDTVPTIDTTPTIDDFNISDVTDTPISDPIGSTTDNTSYDSSNDSSYSESGGYSDSIDTGGFNKGGKIPALQLNKGGYIGGGK